MASERTIAWLERWIWILIYGGLFGVVLGIATQDHDAAVGWTLAVGGAVAAAAGVVLVWVRSRASGTGS